MQRLQINILTRDTMRSREDGQKFFDLVHNLYAGIAPELYGNHEPLRKIFNPDNVEEALEAWGDTFLWKRRRSSIEGSVYSGGGPNPIHGCISMEADLNQIDMSKMLSLVEQLSTCFHADFGFVHLLNEPDIALGMTNDTVFCLDPKRNRYNLSVTTYDLIKYIPDLYWGTILGVPYVQHFGRERVLSAPAAKVKELENGAIYLQLSDNPLDFLTKFAAVDQTRQRVKNHLNSDAFYRIYAGINHSYSVPIFNLQPDQAFAGISMSSAVLENQLDLAPRFSLGSMDSASNDSCDSEVRHLLVSYFDAMHNWEIACWKQFQQNQHDGSYADWLERAQEAHQEFAAKLCTSKNQYGLRKTSFRSPPEYDAQTEMILRVDQRNETATVYTRQYTGFNLDCIYEVCLTKNGWRIDSKKIIDNEGKLIDAVL